MSSRPYLEPEDVSPENARLVLDFLNRAETPEEIAAAVEIPGELDIGVRLAGRLLQRRDELGGFTTIRQVREVPLIGPERFTEIVTTLSSQRLPTPLVSLIEQLQNELAELRRSIARADGARRRLLLRATGEPAYLGQIVTVVATLTDDETPVPDVPVTFVATRGRLRVSDGYSTSEGHLVTARTGVDGTVRLNVLPATNEVITPVQEDALLSMLALLDPKADTPGAATAGLRALAQQYAWEVNLPFRQAVDIYVREFQPTLLDTVNLRENLRAWKHHDSAILAFAPANGTGEEGSSVSATAALHLRVRDWIAAFLEMFVALSREESGSLADELRGLSESEQDPGRLISAIYDRAGAFVVSRWGRVGTWVGRKVAESTIRGFLEQDLDRLPLDTRVDLFPALDIASKTMATADASVIQGLVSTRKEITQDVDRKISRLPDLGVVGGRLSDLEATVAQLPQTSTIDQLRAELLGVIDVTRTQLTTAITGVRTDLTSAIAPLATRAELTAGLATKVETRALDTLRASVDQRFTTINTSIRDLDTRVGRIG
jgi:hypothetical protein